MLENAEHLDGQLLVAAQRKRGGVHHLQVPAHGFIEGDVGITRRSRILFGVGRVHAIHLGRLQHNFCADFSAAQGRCRVGGEKRVAGARRENNNFAFFKVLQRFGHT